MSETRNEHQQAQQAEGSPEAGRDANEAVAAESTVDSGGDSSGDSNVESSSDAPEGSTAPGAGERQGREEPGDEVEILRSELERLQQELSAERSRSEEMRDRFIRARADLENYRKRASADVERAREAGLDSAVLPVLSVFDDLRRALEAVEGADPAQIVPGVQSVLATLERNLENLGVVPVGQLGDRFDPDLHEALTTLPTDEVERSDTIAQVFQMGFRKGERLIRPARVVVFQS